MFKNVIQFFSVVFFVDIKELSAIAGYFFCRLLVIILYHNIVQAI